jgi:hypothetical protein
MDLEQVLEYIRTCDIAEFVAVANTVSDREAL